ncbi:hypothetical protein C0Q70_05005 [Pomacea canaliculata]|uniref:Gamma-glutamyltransferase n=1 Tax=Pomacea canaliculata TaxID=400727 RepID=A0A2T7PJY4_POMCA|nr:hypothetical protein C0Q70_05005 [Pomacea canaliculata]
MSGLVELTENHQTRSQPEDEAAGDPEKGSAPRPGRKGTKSHVSTTCRCCSCSKAVVVAAVGIMCVVYMLAMGLGLGLGLNADATQTDLGVNGSRKVVGAVAADHTDCSEVGRDVLARGGSAVDAAISSLLCTGVRQPHSTGLGGGVYLAVYQKKPQAVEMFDGREVAPLLATYDQYFNKSFFRGGLSIAVPAEIKALWQAHQKYGRLPWKDLFAPAIKMAAEGHPLSHSTARALALDSSKLSSIPGLCRLFCKEDGRTPKVEGDVVFMPALAKTLEGFANHGPDYLYGSNSQVAAKLIEEVSSMGGLLKQEDLTRYQVLTAPPVSAQLGDLTLHTLTAPSGGPVLSLVLRIISGFGLTPDDIRDPERSGATLHKMVESFKFAYADRLKIADPMMASADHADRLRQAIDPHRTYDPQHYTNLSAASWTEEGTTHISIISPEGDAVFGSLVVSESTGLILNNHMADFAKSEGPVLDTQKVGSPNYVTPGKRPLSSMAPAIIVDKDGNPRLVLGSAGGVRITTTNAQVIARNLWLGQSLEDAINEKRLHHQLFPNVLVWEEGLNQDILTKLQSYGHETKPHTSYMAVVQAVARDSSTGEITAFSDPRKHAEARLLYEDELKVPM